MFAYQNKDGNICVTFRDNKPVKDPEYVLIFDAATKTLALEGDDADLNAMIDELNATITEKDAKIKELEDEIAELKKSDAE